jgi:hypothetical protein
MEAFEYIDRSNHPEVVQVGMFTHIATMKMAEELKDGDQFIAIGYPGHYYSQWRDFGGKYKGGHCARMDKPILFTFNASRGTFGPTDRNHLYTKSGFGGFGYELCWKLEPLDR